MGRGRSSEGRDPASGRATARRIARPARRESISPRPWRWTDEAIERELRAFIDARRLRRLPTSVEFDEAGRSDLRGAIRNHGGAGYWAARLGLQLAPGQDREPYGEADAVRDARDLIGQLGHLPHVGAIREVGGYGRLATFVLKYGGSRRFRNDFEV